MGGVMMAETAGALTPLLAPECAGWAAGTDGPGGFEVEIHADVPEGTVELCFETGFEKHPDDFVFMPACCYAGNQFEAIKTDYPPLFTPQQAQVEMPLTITDVPRLEKDGSGTIEVTTGDLAVPCAGVFSKSQGKGLLLYTVQQVEGHNLGLAYADGALTLSWPHLRKKAMYRWPHMVPSTDRGIPLEKGRQVRIPYRAFVFQCDDITEFYRVFFETRKCMGLDDTRPVPLPAAEQWRIHQDKFNRMNWREKRGFYSVGTTDDLGQIWQPGWVGGAMSTLALMKLGGELEWTRGLSTLEYLFSLQAPTGFFYEIGDLDGRPHGMGFGAPGAENWHLVRKSGDVLYFLFLHFRLMESRGQAVPPHFEAGARKVADAFVRLWREYGQFGQFVDLETGKLAVGGSTSGAIVPAGLVAAFRWFGQPEYLKVACAAAELYHRRDLSAGYTTGGPGDMLQCPDSESAFALLESFAALFEETGEALWLRRAEAAAHYCSSWVVAYNYTFPPDSEFARLGMKTTGCVFANLQNKHAAPGICTLPGAALLKLHRWTGEAAYLELLRDIAFSIGQYMSTEARPIWSWDAPKDPALMHDPNATAPREKLPSGFICERVNMSDWEGVRCVGGVFCGSCWPEAANMLTLAEVAEAIGMP